MKTIWIQDRYGRTRKTWMYHAMALLLQAVSYLGYALVPLLVAIALGKVVLEALGLWEVR